jgi:heterotetrameric sarcosine oxidase gamma subunit
VLDLAQTSAFHALRPVGSGHGITVRERKGLALATVMVRKGQTAELAAKVKAQFDIALPSGPHGSGNHTMSFLGTGPSRWLVTHDAPPPRFVEGLAQQLDGLASVVDQSSAYGVLRLWGPAVLDVLAKGVAMDLDAQAFPAGSVALTQIAHIGTTLWKVDEIPTFHVAVARSMAGSFLHWLETSAAMYGLAVDA